MRQVLYDIIMTTATVHRLPVNPDLFARCEHELERAAEDDESVVNALRRAFDWHEKAQQ